MRGKGIDMIRRITIRCITLLVLLFSLLIINGAVASATTSKTPEEVVAFLELDMINHSKDYGADLCLQYISDVYGKMGFETRYNLSSAINYWNILKNEGKAHYDSLSNVPIGADVFFNSGSNFGSSGHVGIYVGDGYIIHNRTLRNPSGSLIEYGVVKQKISDNNYYMSCYLGWAWHDWVSVGGDPIPRKNVLSGVYVIHSAWDDNICLDIQGDSKENNANIQLYQRVYNDVQKFRVIKWNDDYYCVKSIHNGRWLDAKTPIGDNSNVKLYDTNEDDEDFWYFEDAGDGYVYIKNKTGYYLDVQGDRAVNGANIQLYHFVDENNKSQKWRLEDVTNYYDLSDGTYMIHSAINNDYVFDISGNSTENRANIQLYKQENTSVQFYQFTKKGKYYVIRSVYADKWLDIHTPIENNANVQLWESNGAAEEHWVFEDAGNGYVFIRSNADYYLDVQGDQAKNNANIQVYRFAGNNSQKWLLKNIEHKVTFNANGGSGEPFAQTKVLGIELILSKIIPTYDGFTFAGWNSKMDGSGVGYNAGDKYKLDENATLYAVWITPDCVLPDNLVKIDESAFEGCAFSFAKVQPGTTVISEKAFALCQQLKHIYIPESVTEIASNAFNGVTGLTIHGTKGSYAETYASEKGFAFIEG